MASLTIRDKEALSIDPAEPLAQTNKRLTKDRSKMADKVNKAQDLREKEDTWKRTKMANEAAMRTGSAKKLLPNQRISIPPLITLPDGTITGDETTVHDFWISEFDKTYDQSTPPTVDKPWLRCQTARRFQQKTGQEPFHWPLPISATSLRNLLGHGKPDPAPGPDDWEKWALKNSGEDWLSATAHLVNFVTANAYFTDEMRDNHLIPIYKKGDFTCPTNYRGIVLANTLQITTASWLQHNLQAYSQRLGLIPPTQSAGRKDCRPSDQTHLLHAIDGYLRQKNKIAFAIKRDQKKSFDKSHFSGIEDAIDFFGLPRSIIAFEKARATNVRLRLRIRGKTLRPITTDGQTKQGDPLSPLKYALTLAMAQWWIEEIYPQTGLTFKTHRYLHAPHSSLDTERMILRLIAAMDDTIAFAVTKEHLILLILALEDFQLAYNMETEWDKPNKTTLMVFGRPDKSADYTITINLAGGRSKTLTPVKQEDRRFLNTPVNDPNTQYNILLDILKKFTFPHTGRTLALPAISRIAHTSLATKLSTRLEMHSITPRQAEDLRTKLGAKISKYYNFTYPASSKVLCGDVEAGGMGFPDPVRINAVCAITPIHRLLNSDPTHLGRVFEIIHAEWQCAAPPQGHGCWSPFAGRRHKDAPAHSNTKDTVKSHHKVWENAVASLTSMGAQIIPLGIANASQTPQSIQPGKWAKYNATKRQKAREQSGSSQDPAERPGPKTGFQASNSSTLPGFHKQVTDVMNHAAAHEFAKNWPFIETSRTRQGEIVWATDGSADVVKRGTQHNTGFALTGPMDLKFRLTDEHASIQDAEVAAVTMAVELDHDMRRKFNLTGEKTRILSDHLATVKFVEDLLEGKAVKIKSSSASRHARRGLEQAVRKHEETAGGSLSIEHVKAHTDDTSLEATLNRKVDTLAKEARTDGRPFAFTLNTADHYVLSSEREGVSHAAVKKTLEWLHSETHRPVIFRLPGTQTPDPNNSEYTNKYIFTKNTSSFAAEVQLLVRSHQLPTWARNSQRNTKDPERDLFHSCHFCTCHKDEVDEAHLFVICPGGEEVKADTLERIKRATADAFDREEQERHQPLINALFHDDPIWAGGKSVYWQGLLPGNFTYGMSAEHKKLYDKMAGLCVSATCKIWWKNRKKQWEEVKRKRAV